MFITSEAEFGVRSFPSCRCLVAAACSSPPFCHPAQHLNLRLASLVAILTAVQAASARDARARALLNAGTYSDHLSVYRLFLLWHGSAKKPVLAPNVSVSVKLAGADKAISLTDDRSGLGGGLEGLGGGGGKGRSAGKGAASEGAEAAASLFASFGFSYDDYADLGYPPVDMSLIRPFISLKRMREFSTLVVRCAGGRGCKRKTNRPAPWRCGGYARSVRDSLVSDSDTEFCAGSLQGSIANDLERVALNVGIRVRTQIPPHRAHRAIHSHDLTAITFLTTHDASSPTTAERARCVADQGSQQAVQTTNVRKSLRFHLLFNFSHLCRFALPLPLLTGRRAATLLSQGRLRLESRPQGVPGAVAHVRADPPVPAGAQPSPPASHAVP